MRKKNKYPSEKYILFTTIYGVGWGTAAVAVFVIKVSFCAHIIVITKKTVYSYLLRRSKRLNSY